MTLLSALALGFMFTSIGSYGWYLAISGNQSGDKLSKHCDKGYHLNGDGMCENNDGEIIPPVAQGDPVETGDMGIFYNFGKFIDDCFFFGGLYILDHDE